MGQHCGFSEYQLAHRLKVMKGGAISQFPQCIPHFRENQLWLVPERKQCLSAPEPFSLVRDCENFFGRHRVCASLARVATEGAITAIVATEIRQWKKNFAGIRDNPRLEPVTEFSRRRKEVGQFFRCTSHPAERFVARNSRRPH